MSHFGHSTEVNVCVKQLLVSFHGIFIWLDQKVSMDIELIATITRLPLAVLDPTPFFSGKEKDIALMNKLQDKYDPTRDNKGFFTLSMITLLGLMPRL